MTNDSEVRSILQYKIVSHALCFLEEALISLGLEQVEKYLELLGLGLACLSRLAWLAIAIPEGLGPLLGEAENYHVILEGGGGEAGAGTGTLLDNSNTKLTQIVAIRCHLV